MQYKFKVALTPIQDPGFEGYYIATVPSLPGIVTQGKNKEEALLKSCYTNSMELALKEGIKTISFPNISTGIYHFPKQLAASIAMDTVKNLERQAAIEEVLFVCFDEENYNIYKQLNHE